MSLLLSNLFSISNIAETKVNVIVSLIIDSPKIIEKSLGYLYGLTIRSGTTVSMLHITEANRSIWKLLRLITWSCQSKIIRSSIRSELLKWLKKKRMVKIVAKFRMVPRIPKRLIQKIFWKNFLLGILYPSSKSIGGIKRRIMIFLVTCYIF